MPVLADHQDLPCLIEGHHRDGPGMLHHLALDDLAVRHQDRVAAERDDGAPGVLGGGDHRPLLGNVLEDHPLTGDHALAAARRPVPLAVTDRACSFAAETSPVKSGCGRVGRDRNSGWACVATK